MSQEAFKGNKPEDVPALVKAIKASWTTFNRVYKRESAKPKAEQ